MGGVTADDLGSQRGLPRFLSRAESAEGSQPEKWRLSPVHPSYSLLYTFLTCGLRVAQLSEPQFPCL